MQEIEAIFAKPKLMRSDLMELRYLATQGDPEEAGERMMAVESAIWRAVTSPDYEGDIEPTDLED